MWPDLGGIAIYIRPGKTDMRKQIDGLARLVEEGMGKKPFTGDLFLSCGRGMTMVKALYWDRNGFCLWYFCKASHKYHYAKFPIM